MFEGLGGEKAQSEYDTGSSFLCFCCCWWIWSDVDGVTPSTSVMYWIVDSSDCCCSGGGGGGGASGCCCCDTTLGLEYFIRFEIISLKMLLFSFGDLPPIRFS